MAIKLLISLVKFKIKLVNHLMRRGKGIFRFLFWIDDFIRLLAMTLFFILLSKMLNLGSVLTAIFVGLGAIIDVHDFLSDNSIGKFEFNEK